jgi:hypothetical protein
MAKTWIRLPDFYSFNFQCIKKRFLGVSQFGRKMVLIVKTQRSINFCAIL